MTLKQVQKEVKEIEKDLIQIEKQINKMKKKRLNKMKNYHRILVKEFGYTNKSS